MLSSSYRQSISLSQFAKTLDQDIVIIDEIGYLPMRCELANLSFYIIAALYEKCSLIVTGNLPFGQWEATFAKDATLAAALHDSDCITPTSCRLPGRVPA